MRGCYRLLPSPRRCSYDARKNPVPRGDRPSMALVFSFVVILSCPVAAGAAVRRAASIESSLLVRGTLQRREGFSARRARALGRSGLVQLPVSTLQLARLLREEGRED